MYTGELKEVVSNKLTSKKGCVFLWCGSSALTLHYLWSTNNRKIQFPHLPVFLRGAVGLSRLVWVLKGTIKAGNPTIVLLGRGMQACAGQVRFFTPFLVPAVSVTTASFLCRWWRDAEREGWERDKQMPNRTQGQRGSCYSRVQDKVTWSLKMTELLLVCVCLCVYSHACFCLVSWEHGHYLVCFVMVIQPWLGKYRDRG